MKSKSFMLIAGETSGDMLAAELVKALKVGQASCLPSELGRQDARPTFFGAGGPKMAEAGVDLAIDMTAHSVIGLIEALKSYSHFKKIFNELLQLAAKRRPDTIVCVDFSGFNRRFARAIREYIRKNQSSAGDWHPKIVQFVSPQIWASRSSRAEKMARDIDLLLCIFPFEKEWYAKRVPNLRVEFIGHPIVDRHAVGTRSTASQISSPSPVEKVGDTVERVPTILLLPGSRMGELKRHLPVMLEAAKQISAEHPAHFKMILPDEKLKTLAEQSSALLPNLDIQIGGLAESLSHATLAFASTGTVTMECAYFGVPTIAIYKTSWSTYQIGRRIIQVKYLAMPNLLANDSIYPELIQQDATPEKIAMAANDLLENPLRRAEIKQKLAGVIASLGEVGASKRAAKAILELETRSPEVRG
ncbi:MAG: lipid-A-disaccharide synthase [Verrucomicrobiota bacterium]